MACTTTEDDKRLVQFLLWILAAFTAAVLLIVLILNLQTRTMIFHVNSVSLYPFEVSPSNISATWNISFSIENPSKKISISYDNIKVSVFYHDRLLATTTLVPFEQGKEDKTLRNVTLSLTSLSIDNWVGFEDMNEDKTRRGAVEFDVTVESLVRFDPNSVSQGNKGWLKAYCDRLNIEFSSDIGVGFLDTSKKCNVIHKED